MPAALPTAQDHILLPAKMGYSSGVKWSKPHRERHDTQMASMEETTDSLSVLIDKRLFMRRLGL